MTNNADLTFERLTDWIDNRLSAEEAAEVAHLVQRAAADGGDTPLQADLAWLQAFQQIREQVTLATPPPRVRSALAGRFAEYLQQREAAERAPSLFRQLLATLSFDSATQPTSAGLRSVDAPRIRQLIYATDLLDIAVNLQPAPAAGRTDLLGQILPNNEAIRLEQFSVHLVRHTGEGEIGARSTHEVGITSVDELGEFRFDALPMGDYQLYLSDNEGDVELPPFVLE